MQTEQAFFAATFGLLTNKAGSLFFTLGLGLLDWTHKNQGTSFRKSMSNYSIYTIIDILYFSL